MTEVGRSLNGKVALVTGSSSGAGAQIARELAARGAAVAVHYRSSVTAAESVVSRIAEKGGISAAFKANLTSSEDCRSLASEVRERLGAVDVLINNAGPYVDAPFRSLTPSDWDAIMAVNLKAPYLLAQHLAPEMEALGWGRIVNISATSAYVRTHSVYGLAKAALVHLTEALALEFAPNVTVNAIAPGQIASPRTDLMPAYKASVISDTPLGRLAAEQEVAQIAALFCMPEFDFVTGQTIVVDGGRSLPRVSSIGPELTAIYASS
jgi:NAD(P)-dependent dehydrogenase (short-subunit alcohol dehydrogenase family)